MAHVRLVELRADGSEGDAFEFAVPMTPEGSACSIGSARWADLVLPRRRYSTIAPRQCRLVFRPDHHPLLQNRHGLQPCVVDGFSVTNDRQLDWGTVRLELSGHPFRLEVWQDPSPDRFGRDR